jgi:S1-C subfamily serine protease
VVFVEPGSPAAEAGLRGQDLLVKIGDQNIHSLEQLGKALRLGKAGEHLSIQILRNGDRHILSLHVPPFDDLGGSR